MKLALSFPAKNDESVNAGLEIITEEIEDPLVVTQTIHRQRSFPKLFSGQLQTSFDKC